MTTQSFTGIINTNGEFENVATLTGVTFTQGNTYTVQIQNLAIIKLGDAEFTINDGKPFTYKAGSDDLKIKTSTMSVMLTILENE